LLENQKSEELFMEINAVRGGAQYANANVLARANVVRESAAPDISQARNEVKAQSAELKSDNDLFGAIKTLERSLLALKTTALVLKNGEIDQDEAAKAFADRLENTRYKNANLYENFPLQGGGTTNARDRLSFRKDADAYLETIEQFALKNADALNEVKSRLLGETKKLDAIAQTSYAQSGVAAINPSDIVASMDADYLKTQFAKLTR
jgi:hypothetical protein